MQKVESNVGGTLKAQAVFVANTVAMGHPAYYNRATIAQPEEAAKLGRLVRLGLAARSEGMMIWTLRPSPPTLRQRPMA